MSLCHFGLNCIFARPFSSCGVVPGTIRFVNVGNLRHQWVIGVGVCEHGADRQEDFIQSVSQVHSNRSQEEIPFEIVRAGLHWSLKMSRQMLPLELMLGWYMRVVKLTLGALKG